MSLTIGPPFFDPHRGHAAGRLAQLAGLRELYTQLLLRPAELPFVHPWLHGLVDARRLPAASGVAVHYAGRDKPPELVIFAPGGPKALDALTLPLQESGMPVQVVPGITFHAAARPLRGGGSLGHPAGAAGTMGCVVRHRASGVRFALTCNHVIADLNRAAKGTTEVLEPASGSRIGIVEDFADIDFTPGAHNILDAALARPDRAADIDPSLIGIGSLAGVNAAPVFGASVRKYGAATGPTDGTYLYDMNAMLTYDDGSTALFRDMLGIVGISANFAAKGDSGAAVVDDADAAVGMVIAVASGIDLTMASRITPVLDHFSVDIV